MSYSPLLPGELPAGALFFQPRYVVKIINDLYGDNISLAQARSWAANPPDWVKKKNKLGQDSYRLACFIWSRLAYRFPANSAQDLLVPDSDAALIIQGRWKYNSLSIDTLAEWSVNPPNWKPWNESGDLTATILPAVLWARKVASARAGVDIPFFVDSTVEEVADIVVEENQSLFLGAFEFICNLAASLGISAGMSASQAAGKVAEAATAESAEETIKAVGKKAGKKAVEKGTAKGIKAGATAVVATSDRFTDKAVSVASSAAAAAGVAVVGALIAGGPIGWVGIGALAAAPFLCWGLTEAVTEGIKDNLRDWLPDLVPILIREVYKRVFGSTPSTDQVAELDKRYAGLISANSIAKAVASPENDPRIISAVIRRQAALRAEIIRAIALHRPGCVPDEKRVAELADAAFNKTWTPMDINNNVLAFKNQLCPPPPTVVPNLRVVTVNMRAPQMSRISVKTVGPAIVGKAKPILLSGIGSSPEKRSFVGTALILGAVIGAVVLFKNRRAWSNS
jgi:hypothetical protein